jgi:hypothetical protein
MTAYHLNDTAKKRLIDFLNEFNQLLRAHDLNINFMDGALFSEKAGYLGQLEDNRDRITIDDGQENIMQSSKITSFEKNIG